jgi:hypothetical protein
MAKAQTRGVSAVTVWMIVFVALWLTSTVFLVVLYTDQEALRNSERKMREQKLLAVSGEEERSIDLIKGASQATTMVGILEAERSSTAELATGDGANTAAVVRDRRDALVRRITTDNIVSSNTAYAGQSLVGIAERLYEELRSKSDALTEAQTTVATLQDTVDRHVAANTAQKADYDQRAEASQTLAVQSEQGRSEAAARFTEANARAQADYNQSLEAKDAAAAKLASEKAAAEKTSVAQRARIDALAEKLGELDVKPQTLSTARVADGTVLQAVPGDKMVYISLGENDRLVLGMQFSVYSYKTGIPADGRGKARIEVVSIFGSSSECRIVETAPEEVIFPDDLIANPIYDRNKPQTFVVVGDFDLDYDRNADPDGAETIAALITQWGGIVSTDLSALTDFVVIGASPPRPPAIGRALSPEEAARIETARRAYDRYEATVSAAKDLAVPIMTQNVFLNFLGYGGQRRAR